MDVVPHCGEGLGQGQPADINTLAGDPQVDEAFHDRPVGAAEIQDRPRFEERDDLGMEPLVLRDEIAPDSGHFIVSVLDDLPLQPVEVFGSLRLKNPGLLSMDVTGQAIAVRPFISYGQDGHVLPDDLVDELFRPDDAPDDSQARMAFFEIVQVMAFARFVHSPSQELMIDVLQELEVGRDLRAAAGIPRDRLGPFFEDRFEHLGALAFSLSSFPAPCPAPSWAVSIPRSSRPVYPAAS